MPQHLRTKMPSRKRLRTRQRQQRGGAWRCTAESSEHQCGRSWAERAEISRSRLQYDSATFSCMRIPCNPCNALFRPRLMLRTFDERRATPYRCQRNSRRRDDPIIYETEVAQDGNGSLSRVANFLTRSNAPQCVVARLPSSSPA